MTPSCVSQCGTDKQTCLIPSTTLLLQPPAVTEPSSDSGSRVGVSVIVTVGVEKLIVGLRVCLLCCALNAVWWLERCWLTQEVLLPRPHFWIHPPSPGWSALVSVMKCHPIVRYVTEILLFKKKIISLYHCWFIFSKSSSRFTFFFCILTLI